MGFWNGVSRFAQGKPVFEDANSQSGSGEHSSQGAEQQVLDSSGHKIIPELRIEHCKTYVHDSEMEVTAWITNLSGVEVELDKIILLGKTMEIDHILEPRGSHEVHLYRDEVAENDHYHDASLDYKRRDNGDYFRADFTVEFNYNSLGFYEVEELHPITPVRDI